jgi:hypothetical protein
MVVPCQYSLGCPLPGVRDIVIIINTVLEETRREICIYIFQRCKAEDTMRKLQRTAPLEIIKNPAGIKDNPFVGRNKACSPFLVYLGPDK